MMFPSMHLGASWLAPGRLEWCMECPMNISHVLDSRHLGLAAVQDGTIAVDAVSGTKGSSWKTSMPKAVPCAVSHCKILQVVFFLIPEGNIKETICAC